LIVPDADFERFTENDYDIYLNAVLNPEQVAGKSLLNAISETNENWMPQVYYTKAICKIWDVNCFILLLQAI